MNLTVYFHISPQISFHGRQESWGIVAGSQGEDQLVGCGKDDEDEQNLQLSWLAANCSNASQTINSVR
jgi:hypothetical protein